MATNIWWFSYISDIDLKDKIKGLNLNKRFGINSKNILGIFIPYLRKLFARSVITFYHF